MRYEIICPFCAEALLETNERYRETGPANGSMFSPKQHIVDAGWTTFPLYDTTEYSNLVCPSCEQVLVDTEGRILKKRPLPDKENQQDEFPASDKVPCPHCGEMYKQAGLHIHIKAKHQDQ